MCLSRALTGLCEAGRLRPQQIFPDGPCQAPWGPEARDKAPPPGGAAKRDLLVPSELGPVGSDDGERVASAEESQLCQHRPAILDGTCQKEISSLERHAPNYKIGGPRAVKEWPLP